MAEVKKEPMYVLVGKVVLQQDSMYYQVIGLKDTKLYNITRETMVQATSMGMMKNVRLQRYRGADILRGVDVNINELVAISPAKYERARAQGMKVAEAIRVSRMGQQRMPKK